MNIVTLTEFARTPFGTFSYLRTREFQCYALELPWLDNKPWVSCIPEGDYPLILARYHRGGFPTWKVRNVEGRSSIKFHPANTIDELRGCIAPGFKLAWINSKWAVGQSRAAFNAWMEVMDGLSNLLATELRVRRLKEVEDSG